MTQQTKKQLRKTILTYLRNQEEKDRIEKSLIITNKLLSTPEFQRAESILFYASFDGEVNTFEIMKQAMEAGKNIYLPHIEQDTTILNSYRVRSLDALEVGPYGIQQPLKETDSNQENEKLDLIIVPAIAFDRSNHRLGRGAGYYDRFLALLPKDVPTIGLAFDLQMIEAIPQLEDHDMPVSRVLHN